MIAKMTKDGVLQVFAETEAEEYMLKQWEDSYQNAQGASFETISDYRKNPTTKAWNDFLSVGVKGNPPPTYPKPPAPPAPPPKKR